MEEVLSDLSETLELVQHPTARNKAVASKQIAASSTIVSTPAFISILLESQKGVRCDACFRSSAEGRNLRRCSSCGSYWYCGSECQDLHWRTGHKRMCRRFNEYTSSSGYRGLSQHEKYDSLMLSHLLAQMSLSEQPYSVATPQTSIFLSLLPFTVNGTTPPVCPVAPKPPDQFLDDLYSRFGNNNFAIHSHLTSIGHGIFPIASRLFNHSCVPNAAAKYVLSEGRHPTMKIVALREIPLAEEICIPYLDPALLRSRQQILEISYGFQCDCPACEALKRIGPPSELPTCVSGMSCLARRLREYAGIQFDPDAKLPEPKLDSIPPALQCILQEHYLTQLSETFSQSSHEGQYNNAIESGVTLLSFYLLIYPPNYPQIGMHLLELAKITWNAWITGSADSNGDQGYPLKDQVRLFLSWGGAILMMYGSEGDEDGPLQELRTLEHLLAND